MTDEERQEFLQRFERDFADGLRDGLEAVKAGDVLGIAMEDSKPIGDDLHSVNVLITPITPPVNHLALFNTLDGYCVMDSDGQSYNIAELIAEHKRNKARDKG